MSNEQDVATAQATKEDEQQQAKVVDDGSTKTSKEETGEQEELTAEEKEMQNHKDKVFNGMVDSEILQISKGEKTIEDLDPGMRKAVESRMVIKPEVQKKGESQEILSQLKEELAFDSLLEVIENDEEREEAKADYQAFINSGFTADKARMKVRKMYSLKTNDELADYGQRSHSVGGGKTREPQQQYTAAEKKFLKAMGKKI